MAYNKTKTDPDLGRRVHEHLSKHGCRNPRVRNWRITHTHRENRANRRALPVISWRIHGLGSHRRQSTGHSQACG